LRRSRGDLFLCGRNRLLLFLHLDGSFFKLRFLIAEDVLLLDPPIAVIYRHAAYADLIKQEPHVLGEARCFHFDFGPRFERERVGRIRVEDLPVGAGKVQADVRRQVLPFTEEQNITPRFLDAQLRSRHLGAVHRIQYLIDVPLFDLQVGQAIVDGEHTLPSACMD